MPWMDGLMFRFLFILHLEKERKRKVPQHQISVAVNVHLFFMYLDITMGVCRKTQKKQQLSFHEKRNSVVRQDNESEIKHRIAVLS